MLSYSAVGDFVVIILPIWFTATYLHRLYTVGDFVVIILPIWFTAIYLHRLYTLYSQYFMLVE